MKEDQLAPSSFEKILFCHGTKKYSAQLGTLGFLIFERADVSPNYFVNGIPFIDDIAIVLQSDNEEIPEDFNTIDAAYASSGLEDRQYDPILSYHKKLPMGICDLKFESGVLDRYPGEVKKAVFIC